MLRGQLLPDSAFDVSSAIASLRELDTTAQTDSRPSRIEVLAVPHATGSAVGGINESSHLPLLPVH